mgnify:CR=1 FL=1
MTDRSARRAAAAVVSIAWALAPGSPVADSTLATTGPNLAVNPGVEPGELASDGTNPPGWARWSEPGASGRFTWDNTGGRRTGPASGSNAVMIEDSGLRTGWVSAAPVAVDDRKAYLLSGFVAVNRSAGEVRLAVRFYGGGGLLREVWTPAVSGSTGPETNAWVIVAARVEPPEGATQAVIMCRSDHFVGASWFDDISFHELAGYLPGYGDAREEAFTIIGARFPRDEAVPQAAFDRAFRTEAGAVAVTVESLRVSGGFWETAAISLDRARRLEGAGLTDLEAGWSRRGWGHLRDAANEIRRATVLARRDGLRRDPLIASTPPWPFPFGVSLAYRGPTAPGAIGLQLDRLARWGVQDVQIDFPWGLWEPEAGRYDFNVPDGALAAAAANGQRLYAVSGPQYAGVGGRLPGSPTSLMGFTPWYLRAHPEAALASAAGEAVRDCDGMFWKFAFLDPRTLPAEPGWLGSWRTSLTSLAAHVAGRPGFGGWLLSQHPSLGEGPDAMRHLEKPGLLGHNPEYAALFRLWLKDKYGTPEALRKAWGKGAPATFEKAEPPGPDAIRVDQGLTASRYAGSRDRIADWLLFRSEALAGGLGWQAGVLAQAGGGSATSLVAAPKMGELALTGPLDPDGVAMDAIGAAGTGPVAMDLAPDAVPFPLLTRFQDLAIGIARESGPSRPVWLTDYEFHAGGVLGGDDREDVFPVAYAAPYAASAVLSGARGFFLRGWSGRHGASSLALAPREGSTALTISDEGLAALEIGGALRTIGPWLAAARPASPRYGLLISWRTLLFEDPESYHPLAFLSILALAGIHDVGILTERSLTAGPVPYDVIFAPHVTRLPVASVAALKAFVARGGLLVADTFLASETEDGKPRRPMPDGLDELFGLTSESAERPRKDDMTVGVTDLPLFTQMTKNAMFSLSFYSGSYRVRARPGTEVLAVYTGGKPGQEVPAITLRSTGRGQTAIFPRIGIWGEYLTSLKSLKVPRPELRELRMGRRSHHLNALFCSMNLRGLLERAGALPPARLVQAPISPAFLADQARLALAAGASSTEIARSREIVLATQKGLPHLGRGEIDGVRDQFGLPLDRVAPIRVGVLEIPPDAGASPRGKLIIVASNSSWARDAEIVVPPGSSAVDLLSGDEFAVTNGLVQAPLAPYQTRLLALFP